MLVSSRSVIACVAFFSLLATRGSAQRVTCPKSDSLVARPCELDQPLAEIEPGQRPSYPDILRQAGVSGEVLLRYVVDTNGRALPATVEVLRSSHTLFSTAVKNSMPRQRFELPRRAGVLTSVMVEELVVFSHPVGGWTAAGRKQITTRIVDSTGRLVTTIHTFTPRDSVNAPVLTSSDSLEIYEAVVERLTANFDLATPPVAWCIQTDGRAPSADMLEQWRRKGRKVVMLADCPRTYTTMIRSPADLERPPGWIDPVSFTAYSMVSWAEDTILLKAEIGQGTSSSVSQCEVVRVAGKWTQVFCVTTLRRLS